MFKLIPNPTFAVDVHLSVPGQAEPSTLQITYRHKNKTALAAWLAPAPGTTDAALLGEVIADWSGVLDGDGRPVPYSPAALEELLHNHPTAAPELHRAYLRELTESRRKN